MIKGETVGTGAEHPGTELKVLRSNAGYYIGHLDVDGAPYSRESGYYKTEEAAEADLFVSALIESWRRGWGV